MFPGHQDRLRARWAVSICGCEGWCVNVPAACPFTLHHALGRSELGTDMDYKGLVRFGSLEALTRVGGTYVCLALIEGRSSSVVIVPWLPNAATLAQCA